jgi:hypothetical protein
MTELVFIVSRSEPKQYLYLKHFYAVRCFYVWDSERRVDGAEGSCPSPPVAG